MNFTSSLPEYLVNEMDITPEELARRKSFLNFGARDIELLMELQRFVRCRNVETAFSDAFYQHLTSFPELLRFLPNRAMIERLKKVQAKYFQELISGNYEPGYALNRLKVGYTHQSVGLDPKWYTGAYREYLSLLIPILHEMADGDLA
jgi:Protoglobin